jgi:hypothetical protein
MEVTGDFEERHAHESHTQPDVFGPSVNSVDELQTEEGQLGDFLPNRPVTPYTQSGIDTNAPSLRPGRVVPTHRIAPVPLKPPDDTVGALDSAYSIYSGVDHLGTVGNVAPGIFVQESGCWRMAARTQLARVGGCMEPVAWVRRWKFLKGWTEVWSCERHADELLGRVVPFKNLGRPSK